MPMPVKISCVHPFKGANVAPWAAVDKNGNVTTGIVLNGTDMTAEEAKKLLKVLKKTVEHLDVMAASVAAYYLLPEE